MSRKTKKVAPGDGRKSSQGRKRLTQEDLGGSAVSGDHTRKPSHVPLSDGEREKLHALARSMGLSYAAWARATMLVVADWPLDRQPIRVPVGSGSSVPPNGVFHTRLTPDGEERSYDGGRTWAKEVRS